MLFLFVICFLVEPSQSIGDDKRFTALKFGTTINDYVKFSNYDMSPFRNALTMCSWMRRVYTGTIHQVVLHFHTSSQYWEILISPTGQYNRVAGSGDVDSLNSKFTTPVGTWLHYCVSWTTSTHTIQVYLNGVQVASGQVSYRRQLHTPGTLTIGRAFPNTNPAYIFGGEVFDLNMYTKVLSPEVISRMASRTVCRGAGEYEEDRYRVFRWEQLLEQSRSGAVMEIDMRDTCELEKQLAQQINVTAGTQTDLNQTRKDLATVKAQLNKVLADLNATQQALEAVTGNLNITEEELLETRDSLRDESVRCNRTEEMLTETVSELNMTKGELNMTKGELNMTKGELNMLKGELNMTKGELNMTKGELNMTKGELNMLKGELNMTKGELKMTKGELNQTEEKLETCSTTLVETKSVLNQTAEKLATSSAALLETKGELNRTTEQLETLSLQQEETEENLKKKEEEQEICTSKLEEARKFENISRFDVLFTSPYYNKIFTEELLQRLKSSWNILSKL